MTQDLAARFHDLHADGMLLLANVWDAGSARIAQASGARAVATSSAAVAWAHGWPDGNALPAELLLQTVRAVAAAVTVPLTVDLEAGYSDEPARVAELVSAIVSAGAVGINIEDGNADPGLLCAKISATRAAARGLGVELFINARTDVFLRGLVAATDRVSEVTAREARYRAAGANGLFVPGIIEAGDIAAVIGAIELPLNVMARPNMMPAGELRALGVRRYSAGSAIAETIHGLASAMMREFTTSGRLETFGITPMSYPALNSAMARG